MFYHIQKRLNQIIIVLFILLAIILYGIYMLIHLYTSWNIIGIIFSLMICVLIFSYIISYISKNIESIILYQQIRKKHVVLCQIHKASFNKSYRDILLHEHQIYQFDITIYTSNHQTIDALIYEDVKNNDFKCLPAYCYAVNYNNHIGLVPTYMIFISPQLKEIVKDLEQTYHPHYIEVTKKEGVS
ncbi:MAG: hypothetical protein LUG46_06145 [Erysipelotrichaceae bacterium]|nr:hypothetical protein [Erysipelotrichaceae bacterium]